MQNRLFYRYQNIFKLHFIDGNTKISFKQSAGLSVSCFQCSHLIFFSFQVLSHPIDWMEDWILSQKHLIEYLVLFHPIDGIEDSWVLLNRILGPTFHPIDLIENWVLTQTKDWIRSKIGSYLNQKSRSYE